jgi:hypothetical protein
MFSTASTRSQLSSGSVLIVWDVVGARAQPAGPQSDLPATPFPHSSSRVHALTTGPLENVSTLATTRAARSDSACRSPGAAGSALPSDARHAAPRNSGAPAADSCSINAALSEGCFFSVSKRNVPSDLERYRWRREWGTSGRRPAGTQQNTVNENYV